MNGFLLSTSSDMHHLELLYVSNIKAEHDVAKIQYSDSFLFE